jgi:beta-glucosidase
MKSRTAYLAATLLSSTVALSGAQAQDMIYKDKSAPLDARVDDLMARLTLDERSCCSRAKAR